MISKIKAAGADAVLAASYLNDTMKALQTMNILQYKRPYLTIGTGEVDPGFFQIGALAEGHAQVISIVLDNPYMTEAQILRALSREKLPVAVIPAIVRHHKWSITYNVRLALVRHPSAPLATILSYLPELTVSDLRELAAPGIVPEGLRKYLQAEVQRRVRASEKAARGSAPAKDPSASNRE